MKLSFLRFFKWARGVQPAVAESPALPARMIDKPTSERFGHTVMPNVSRFVGLTPQSDSSEPRLAEIAAGMSMPTSAVAQGYGSATSITSSPRAISLGNLTVRTGGSEGAKETASERTISLQLADIAPHLPEGLLKAASTNLCQRVSLRASELERGMSSGHPSVQLRAIYQQAPDFFTCPIDLADETEVALPFGKVLEQFTALQVRSDQVSEVPIAEVQTPFLQVTLEDGKRFPAASAPVPPPAPSVPEQPAVSETAPAGPIRLPLPPEAQRIIPASASAPATPVQIDPTRAPAPTSGQSASTAQTSAPAPRTGAIKFSPNGTGEPASERVPASSGPSVPTPLSSPVASAPAPAAAPKIAFKITPPPNEVLSAIAPQTAAPAAPGTPPGASSGGPRISLPLVNILRGIAPAQLSGAREEVPETVRIEIPFSVVQPQLSLGKVAISPSQFQGALPEEWRSHFKIEDMETPIPLDLQEVLRNLPNDSLQIRSDQEAADVGSFFETPFSQKAAEDAARLTTAAVEPAAKPKIAPAPVMTGTALPGPTGTPQFTALPKVALKAPTQPGSPIPATAPVVPPAAAGGRTALQVEFDTDEVIDPKAVVNRVSALPGMKACAIVFSDGLSLAGNLPAEYEADALCAMAPAIMKKIGEQMGGAKLGGLNSLTVFCAGAALSLFTGGNICLATLHGAGEEIRSEVRVRLGRIADGLSRTYAKSA